MALTESEIQLGPKVEAQTDCASSAELEGDVSVHSMRTHLTNEERGALLDGIIGPQGLKHGETIEGAMPDGDKWRIQCFKQDTGDTDREMTWYNVEVGRNCVTQIVCLDGGFITSARSIMRNANGTEESNVHDRNTKLDVLIELIAQSKQGESPFDMEGRRASVSDVLKLQ